MGIIKAAAEAVVDALKQVFRFPKKLFSAE